MDCQEHMSAICVISMLVMVVGLSGCVPVSAGNGFDPVSRESRVRILLIDQTRGVPGPQRGLILQADVNPGVVHLLDVDGHPLDAQQLAQMIRREAEGGLPVVIVLDMDGPEDRLTTAMIGNNVRFIEDCLDAAGVHPKETVIFVSLAAMRRNGGKEASSDVPERRIGQLVWPDQELCEGGLTFGSKLALSVLVSTGEGDIRVIGDTAPLAIPKCRWWAVMPSAGVTVADLVAEAKATPIRGVVLGHASDADLEQLKSWSQLQTLDLTQTRITNAGLVQLAGLKMLQVLRLAYTEITDSGLASVGKLVNLRELSLGLTGITDAGLAHLVGLTRLQTLELSHTPITDAGLVRLKGLKTLQVLDITGTDITDAGLRGVGQLKGLQKLSVSGTNITDAGLPYLKDLKELRVLDLSSTHISDAGLGQLVELRALQKLSLDETNATDIGVAQLAQIKTLRVISLCKTKVTATGEQRLRDALPNTVIKK